MNKNLWLMVVAQGLFLTNNIAFIAINGLVGLNIAPQAWMATLPVMGYVVGGALSAPLVARTQRLWGRKASFQIGLAIGLVSVLLCAYAAFHGQFWLLVLATAVAGYYNANGQLYRFAAAELSSPSFREQAVSLVLAGGLIGAVFGPNLAAYTRHWFEVPFVGAYVTLAGVALIGMVAMQAVRFPPVTARSTDDDRGRPMKSIMRQPTFIVAAIASALGFGVMNLLMAATPIAMHGYGLPFEDAALVLEWHVIGMFAPGFFTGHLIKRFGVLPIMGTGVLLNMLCIAIALSGVHLHHFLISLFLLGVGWNFLFTGGTTLSLETYTPQEKDKAQAALNFCVFFTLALTSFASGAVVTTQGWQLLNVASLSLVSFTGAALLWLGLQRRIQAPA
jgi:MFS family permease